MKHIILKAVAMPATLFWVPYKMAILNIAIFAVFFVLGIVVFQLNPIFAFAGLIAGHVFLIGATLKEPHLDGLVEAWFVSKTRTRNLIQGKGNKFIA